MEILLKKVLKQSTKKTESEDIVEIFSNMQFFLKALIESVEMF